MVLRKEITLQIKDLLKENPQGLSITDIVKVVAINRNTAGRYLENLLISGQVEMRRLGMAKIYVLSQRVPLSAVLSISSELIMQMDSSLRIIFANEPFLKLIGTDSKSLVGKNIEYTPVALVFDEVFTEFIENIRQGIAGEEWSGEIALNTKDIILFCRIAPTVFDDGKKGVSVIFEDITQRKQAERKIEESERQFRLLAENSIDMISRVKPDGTRIYISPAYKVTLGYEPEELLGKREDFIHPNDAHLIESLRNALTPQNSFKTIAFRTKHKDGHYIWIESTIRAIFDEKTRELSEYYTVTRDITERKKAEMSLKESEERYRQLVDISPDAVIIHRVGKIIFMNPAALTLIGASCIDDMLGKNVIEFIQPEFRDAVMKNIQKDLDGAISPPIELHMLRVDGSSVIVEGRGVGTIIDGKPAVQVAIRDITERKQAEEALRESEGKLNAMLQSIPDIMSMMDKDLTIVWANEPAKRYFGKDIIGKKCYEVYHLRRDPCEPYPCLTLKAFLDGKTHEHETTVIDNQGENRFFECTATVALRDNSGKPVAVLETSRDITDKKKTEDALRESEARIRLILDSTDDIIIMQNPEGRYLFFNSAARYGVSEEEMLGKTPYDFLDRESADLIVERVKKVAKTGRSIREESPLVWKGQTLWFNDSLSPVRGVDGTITAVVTISQNITDRRNAEEALIHNEQRYRNLITAIGDIIWETDAQSRFVYVSPQVETILGYTPDELIGHTPFEFLHPDSIGHNHKTFQTAVERHEKSFLHVSQWIHKDGHKVLLESNAIPRYDGKGSFSGFIGIDRQRQ